MDRVYTQAIFKKGKLVQVWRLNERSSVTFRVPHFACTLFSSKIRLHWGSCIRSKVLFLFLALEERTNENAAVCYVTHRSYQCSLFYQLCLIPLSRKSLDTVKKMVLMAEELSPASVMHARGWEPLLWSGSIAVCRMHHFQTVHLWARNAFVLPRCARLIF